MSKEKKTAITVRFEPETLKLLEDRAKKEDRNRAKMAEVIVKKELEKK